MQRHGFSELCLNMLLMGKIAGTFYLSVWQAGLARIRVYVFSQCGLRVCRDESLHDAKQWVAVVLLCTSVGHGASNTDHGNRWDPGSWGERPINTVL